MNARPFNFPQPGDIVAGAGRRFVSVQTVSATLYCRYNDATEYTADASLPIVVNPTRSFVISNFVPYYDSTDNGAIAFKFELLSDGSAVRWTYVGNKSQNAQPDWSVAATCTVYELHRPLRSKQLITTQGASVALAQAVDVNRAYALSQSGYSGATRANFLDTYLVDKSTIYLAGGAGALAYPLACVVELP